MTIRAGWSQCEKGRRGRERGGPGGGYGTCELYFIEFGKAVLCTCVLKVNFRIS